MSMSLKISIAIAILAEIYRLWRNHRAMATARQRA